MKRLMLLTGGLLVAGTLATAEFAIPKAGTFIPKTVIVDPEVTRVIAFVPYSDLSEMNKALSKAKKAITHTFISGSGNRSGAARSSRPGSKPKPTSPASTPEK